MIDNIDILIDSNDQKKRLDVFLSNKLRKFSRSQIKRFIDDKFILINGIYLKPKYILKKNDLISVMIPRIEKLSLKAENLNLNIIFSDNDIVVINKTPNIVMFPGAGHLSKTLANGLIYNFPEILKNKTYRFGIVHRLDKETSGVMVCAKNNFSYEKLKNSFKKREVKKIYSAFCFGSFNKINFELKTIHKRDSVNRKKFTSKIKIPLKEYCIQKIAYSKFKILNNFDVISELQIELFTGRTHQIRVQLADINHNILADKLYGDPRKIKNIKIPIIRNLISELSRQALHSRRLSFTHPRTKKYMTFEADLPNDLSNFKLNLQKIFNNIKL